MPTDARGRLEDERFGHRLTKDGHILVSFDGRQVTAVGGRRAERLAAELQAAGADVARMQMLLAKVTGNFKHGNERREVDAST
jgi:hypothetical protein